MRINFNINPLLYIAYSIALYVDMSVAPLHVIIYVRVLTELRSNVVDP
jgi:hypothetical protein